MRIGYRPNWERGDSLVRKFVNRLGVEGFARPQNRGREIGMIRRVRIMLRLEAERAVLFVGNSALAHDCAVQTYR